jgi:hypothetical protein
VIPSGLLWSAPAKRSGDGAFAPGEAVLLVRHVILVLMGSIQSQSGIALRLPPHSI